MKIWINGNDSLEIKMPEEVANKEQLEELINQLADVRTFIEIMDSKGKLIKQIQPEVPHKKAGRPVGSKTKVHHVKKAKRPYHRREQLVTITPEVPTEVSNNSEVESVPEGSELNGNMKYTREQLKAILKAHYNKEISTRDRLMLEVGMTKSTFYVMKNYWVKKFNFNSQELGLE